MDHEPPALRLAGEAGKSLYLSPEHSTAEMEESSHCWIDALLDADRGHTTLMVRLKMVSGVLEKSRKLLTLRVCTETGRCLTSSLRDLRGMCV